MLFKRANITGSWATHNESVLARLEPRPTKEFLVRRGSTRAGCQNN